MRTALIALSLAGCATAPPPIDPGFLATAVVVEAPASSTDPIVCRVLLARKIAFVRVTTGAINECLPRPKTSKECQILPVWKDLEERIVGGTDAEVLACAEQVPVPEGAEEVARAFGAAVQRLKRKFAIE